MTSWLLFSKFGVLLLGKVGRGTDIMVFWVVIAVEEIMLHFVLIIVFDVCIGLFVHIVIVGGQCSPSVSSHPELLL